MGPGTVITQTTPRSLVDKLNLGHVIFDRPAFPELGPRLYGLAQWQTTYRGVDIVSHGGSIHGQLSLIIRIPSRKIGFWLATNDQDFGIAFNTVVGNRVLDNLLGLEPIDWESRMFEPMLEPKIQPEIPPARRPPPSNMIHGTYFNLGYGSLNLRRFGTSPLAAALADVLAKGGLSLDYSNDKPMYLAVVKKSFLTHLVFQHKDGPIFDWIATVMFDAIDQQAGLVGIMYGTGQAVIISTGIGMFGGWWGHPGSKGLTVTEEKVAEKAETWFSRVEVH